MVFKRKLVLAQLADALIGVHRHIAGAGHQIATQNFHKSGFAAAVGANQAVAIAVAELDGNVFKQGLSPELHGDIRCCNQGKLPECK